MKKDYEEFTSNILMNKNTPVLQFLYDEETHSVIKIEKVFNEAYAPLGLVDYKTGISRKLFNTWWNNRAIPTSRENFSRIMQLLQIDSSVELLERCSGFSLSDQYWIKNSDSQVQWKDLNFFENSFSEDIGKLLLGQIDMCLNLDLVSPDNASDGDLIKKWKIIEEERFLIKGGNSLNNQEPYNEYIATLLYERVLNPNEFVPYFLIQDNGKIYSACKTMVSTDEELVSALAIDSTIKLRGAQSLYDHFIEASNNLGINNVEIMINKMLTCDYILANYDRHYRNFGAIRNVETLEWKGFAPLYDTGSSLWARTPTSEISSFNYKSKPFRSDPQEQFKLVKNLSWLDEKKLLGFENDVKNVLSQNPLMDTQRISLITRCVKDRINFVLTRKKELELNKQPSLNETIYLFKEKSNKHNVEVKNEMKRKNYLKDINPKR